MDNLAKEVLKYYEDNDEYLDKNDEYLREIEEGDWFDDGKYSFKETIVEHIPSGRLFSIGNSRSGSYHTDYYYDEPTVNEVKAEQVTVTRYVSI